MIGLIPRIWMMTLEQLTEPEKIRSILTHAGIPEDRKFAIDEPYEDAEFLGMVNASADVLRMKQDDLIQAFSETFIKDATSRWPVWFEMAPDARSFLERQPRIHGSFSRSLDDAENLGKQKAQKFKTSETEDGLRVEYRSSNKLCGIYKSLAQSVLRHYNDDDGRVHEVVCMHDGHDHCDIRITWPR